MVLYFFNKLCSLHDDSRMRWHHLGLTTNRRSINVFPINKTAEIY